ncbi:MAG: A/G-specific adenine glycosylase [Proteobacteria bacterium]|nr:A/G-specific adenine glycosylase [Pseudomonadota bacterium]
MNLLSKKSFKDKLNTWYIANKRNLPWRETKNPYHIWVSEVMLQQTQVITVIDYFNRFIDYFPDIKTLSQADLQAVLKHWEGLGYYSRARNLHRAARQLIEDNRFDVPDTPEEFRKLMGVGDYINAAVQSIAFGHALAVVDGNVKRVLSRVFMMDMPVNQSGAHAAFYDKASLLLDENDPSTSNQAMMELGALVCKPKRPLCGACPVSRFCKAFKNKRTDEYPKRVTPRKIPTRQMVAGLIVKNDQFLIVQREEHGFLGGMWELPGGPVTIESPEESLASAVKKRTGISVTVTAHLTHVGHAYTHFKLKLSVYLCHPVSPVTRLTADANRTWIHPKDIPEYPFHKAMHKCFPKVIDYFRKAS